MGRRTLGMIVGVVALAGCGQPSLSVAPMVPVQAAAAPNGSLDWLTPDEKLAAEKAIKRELEKRTPDTLIKFSNVTVQQKLVGFKYAFSANKAVLGLFHAQYYRMSGFYYKRTGTVEVTSETKVGY